MRKIFKLFIALCILAAFTVFSVLCCCTAASLSARFHKDIVCSHCQPEKSNKQSSAPAETCHHQFIGAESSTAFTLALVSGDSSSTLYIVEHAKICTVPLLLRIYPPGGPPLGISLTPLYLRTFQLRI